MQCAMFLWPHANARYREAIRPLAERELLFALMKAYPGRDEASFAIGARAVAGVEALAFDLPDLSADLPGCLFAPRCPYADGRCRTSHPTETALADEAENHKKISAYFARCFSGVDESEFDVMRGCLGKLEENLRSILHESPDPADKE